MKAGQLKQTLNQLPDDTELLLGIEIPGLPPEFCRISVSEQAEFTPPAEGAHPDEFVVRRALGEDDSLDAPNGLILWVSTAAMSEGYLPEPKGPTDEELRSYQGSH